MNTTYYARPGKGGSEGQLLKDHLLAVSKLARKNARYFGADDAAAFCGLIHDLGKYSEAFQKVLTGEEHFVDHAAAGAYLQFGAYKNHVNAIGRAVFAHHSRLEYGIQNQVIKSVHDPNAEPLDPRKRRYAVNSGEAIRLAYAAWLREVSGSYPLPKARIPFFSEDRNPALSEMLYTRFLLSCLVDADYTDAAVFDSHDAAILAEDAPLEPERLFARLQERLREVRSHSAASPAINSLRDEVLQDCLSAANVPPGLFTLTAPTGLGKTLSMLAFALRHAEYNHLRRIFIVLPYLTILEQNADEYRKIEPALLEDHSQTNLSDEQRLLAERYAAPVIITTSVKFFESLFPCRATDCRKLHNISGSVILFDEAQSLPSDLTSTTLETMRQLCARYGCSVVFSTATQPSFARRPDVVWEPKEIICRPKELFLQTRRCEVAWETERESTCEEIAERMAGERNCCAIVNTKAQARALYCLLKALLPKEDAPLYLSTDLCPAHRRAVVEEIRRRQAEKSPIWIVSTQCIEAGVDLSFDCMFRALAPLPSIVQSAGRVNRGGNDRMGRLVVWLPGGRDLYPDSSYSNAALAVQILLKRRGGKIDLQNLDDLREYYDILYQDERHNHDKPKLTRAIKEYDFSTVDEEYLLIPNRGVNVIVPYGEQRTLFEEICSTARQSGITAALMKQTAPITVRSVSKLEAQSFCEPFYYPPRTRGEHAEQSDWYAADASTGLYHEETGLFLKDSSAMNTIL